MKNLAAKILLLVTIAVLSGCSTSAVQSVDQNAKSLEEQRKGFATNLLIKGPAPQEYEMETPPEGVSEVNYQSGDLELKAWISNASADGGKRPALVFAHGGYAFGSEDWDMIKPYLDNGFIVMMPMTRGENGNPGNFECFYGEVDDIIAAGQYLSEQVNVDSSKIFLAGHSTGGTLAMLTAMMPSPYKAIATFGASPDQALFFEYMGDRAPFDLNDPKEISLRSPIQHINSVNKPLYIYVGADDEAYKENSVLMAKLADENGKTVKCSVMQGDHFTSVEGSITESINAFK